MEILLSIIGIAILGAVVYLIWKLQAGGSKKDDSVDAEKMELQRKLDEASTKRDEFAGKNKELFVQKTNLEADLKAVTKERDVLDKKVTVFETEKEGQQQAFRNELKALEESRKKFDDEQRRTQQAEADRLQHEIEERDRIWAEHERNVILKLTELCKLPQYNFSYYTNENPPEDLFLGKGSKPDFMIDFIGQYLIFDAKKSKPDSLQTYINTNYKDTAEKYKGNAKLATTIFFVVPTEAISELKTHHYSAGGFTFYVIPIEALAPILASLKRISQYEFAEQMDPQYRENIIQVIAEMDFHINLRNAADVMLSKVGVELLRKVEKLDPQMASEIALKKQPMNAKASLSAAEIKRLVTHFTTQDMEIEKLVSPKAGIAKKDMQVFAEIIEA